MKELAESFHVVVTKTGGVALLAVLPAIPIILLYVGLQLVERSLRRRKRHAIACQILSRPRYPGDEFYRETAETVLKD